MFHLAFFVSLYNDEFSQILSLIHYHSYFGIDILQEHSKVKIIRFRQKFKPKIHRYRYND